MSTLFISDLHLDPGRPNIVELFEQFLATQARAAEALYILGDLFESWVGDDDDAPLAHEVAIALRALHDTGVPMYFMHGNRDFLLGEDYARRAGLTLLSDPTVIDLHGERTLLMHGDTLCTDDSEYQKFRAQVRDPEWQKQFLSQSLQARRAFAQQARKKSYEYTSAAAEEIMDVNPAAVEHAFREHDVLRLIHGHTHRPATHRLTIYEQNAERIVLGDWYEHSSVLTWPRLSVSR